MGRMRMIAGGALAAMVLLLAPASIAQERAPCDAETRQLRWLVQKYGTERTELEFALAKVEAARQAAEAETRRLREELGRK